MVILTYRRDRRLRYGIRHASKVLKRRSLTFITCGGYPPQTHIPTKGLKMSNPSPSQHRPYFPWGAFLLCLTGLIVGVGFLLTRDTEPAALAADNADNAGEVTAGQAARIHSLVSSTSGDLPLSTTNRGTVVDISENRIVVSHDGREATWPFAADLQIWKNREAIEASDVKPGDIVEVDLQQLGSRSDGWMNTAVKINVVSSDLPDTTTSRDVVMPRTTFDGIVVESRAGVIVVADEQGRESTLPLKSTALIVDGVETIGLDALTAGDKVKLTTSKVGSRADGWTSMVDHIEVQRQD